MNPKVFEKSQPAMESKRTGQTHEIYSLIMEKPISNKISRLPARVFNIKITSLFPEPPIPYQ